MNQVVVVFWVMAKLGDWVVVVLDRKVVLRRAAKHKK